MLKKVIYIVIVVISTFLFNDIVNAKISKTDMNRLRLVYSDARLSIMTEEEMQEKLQFDLEGSINNRKYFKGVTNHNNDSITWTEISENEYNSIEIPQYSIMSNSHHETTYKYVDIRLLDRGSNLFDVMVRASWKIMPSTRSFDVIAMRYQNFAVYPESLCGYQLYKNYNTQEYQHIRYSYNGTNIHKENDGFGISMNLVNNRVNYLDLEIDATGIITSTNPFVFGSYQHSGDNINLQTSQQYTISSAGYGNVINFSPSVELHYDNMEGVFTPVVHTN